MEVSVYSINYKLILFIMGAQFIIEILPKRENGNQFVHVVRAANGFPISVCDTLDVAKDVIQEKFDELRKQNTND